MNPTTTLHSNRLEPLSIDPQTEKVLKWVRVGALVNLIGMGIILTFSLSALTFFCCAPVAYLSYEISMIAKNIPTSFAALGKNEEEVLQEPRDPKKDLIRSLNFMSLSTEDAPLIRYLITKQIKPFHLELQNVV